MLSLPRESESFYLLLNFDYADSGLAVKMFSASGLILIIFISVRHFYCHRHHPVR